jgi:pimeloyl-ACP methyl ester carboxylesterase
MPAVFVHGVPDTPEVWEAVVSRLGRKDVVRLALPGFACPLPAGFDATKDEYVDWILAQRSTSGHGWPRRPARDSFSSPSARTGGSSSDQPR